MTVRSNPTRKRTLLLAPAVALACLFWAGRAFASKAEIDQLSSSAPWETGLGAIMESLTGPIAATVAIAAFALCTWQIIRGAELSSWVAPMIVAALAVATLVNADTLIETLSGTTVNGFESAAVLEASPQRGAAEDLIGPSCSLR